MKKKISHEAAWEYLKGSIVRLGSCEGHDIEELKQTIAPSLYIIPKMIKSQQIKMNEIEYKILINGNITLYKDMITNAELNGQILYFEMDKWCFAYYICKRGDI